MAKKQPKLDNELYEAHLTRLQAELVEMQEWVKATGARLVVLFEGRDAAGKGGSIKRITEYLNPRVAQVVALPTPTERQKTQWYFQRYIEQLPAAGEIRLFDRSWYNRAGVERVMGYCTPEEYQRFLRQVPIFERMLIDDGIMLRKYWFSVSDKEQERRFRSRMTDPMRRWKLSPTDLESLTRWEEYSRAKDDMFIHTDIEPARWRVVEAEDKKRARINMITDLLATVPYEHVARPDITFPKRPKSTGYRRTDSRLQQRVPNYASKLERGTPPSKYLDPEDSDMAKESAHTHKVAAHTHAPDAVITDAPITDAPAPDALITDAPAPDAVVSTETPVAPARTRTRRVSTRRPAAGTQ